MKLIDTIDLFPGCPGAWTHPNGCGVQLRFPTTHAPRRQDGTIGPGRMTLDLTLAVDYAFERNEGIFHFITQMRANVAGWDSGYYSGHGAIVGPVFDPHPCAKIESWGPHYNPNGPGGNIILPRSHSPKLKGATLYRLRITSMQSAAGFKHIGYSVWEPNEPALFDTGDCEDDNMSVDMNSDALLIAVHFQPKDEWKADPGIVRISNVHINHTPDCTPMPDLRRLTGAHQ